MIVQCLVEGSKYVVDFIDYGMKCNVYRHEIDTRRFGMTTPPMAVSFRLEGEICDQVVLDTFFRKLAEEVVKVELLPLGRGRIRIGTTFVDRYEDLAAALCFVTADTMVNKFSYSFSKTLLTS